MTLLETVLDETVDLGPDEVAHVVIPKAAWTEAIVMGTPCRALCDYVWVPHRLADDLPRCARCLEVYDALRAAQGRAPRTWT